MRAFGRLLKVSGRRRSFAVGQKASDGEFVTEMAWKLFNSLDRFEVGWKLIVSQYCIRFLQFIAKRKRKGQDLDGIRASRAELQFE
ncbi:hypothetical protein R1flu_017560 [Riccia fluitans]|uniref:Uncharacterized protein n=1 Tax=Riccia fluitans TaxID=41844 RepID=A0ABD1ZED5_9MARC